MENKTLNMLIVEDEIIASEYLLSILKSLGYENNFTTSCMQKAVEIVKTHQIDLVFMDINIEGSVDGISCAKILNQHYFLPIIFTTAYKDEQTLQEASETNIFGYIIKPFEVNEVKIALLIALKRIYKEQHKNDKPFLKNVIELGEGYSYNFETLTFYNNYKVIGLTKKENDLLSILCKNINQNISSDTIKEYVWGNQDITNSTLRDTMSRMKKKAPLLKIETIINFGYILKV